MKSYINEDKATIINHINSFGKKLGIVFVITWSIINIVPCIVMYILDFMDIENNIMIESITKIFISVTSNMFPFIFLMEGRYYKIGKKNKNILDYILLILIFIMFILVSNCMSGVFGKIFAINTKSQDFNFNNIFECIVFIFSAVIVPAVTEEFAFRRCLLNSLIKYGDSIAIIVSSICFGLLHGNIVQILFAILCGLALGYIYIYTKSYVFVVCLHIINNSISFIFSLLLNRLSITKYNYISYIFIVIFIILGVISFIYLSRRKNDFLSINKFEDDISFSERIKALVYNFTMVCAVLLIVISVVSSLRVIWL